MDFLALSAADATVQFLKKGGPFMVPLVLCSMAGLTAIGYKFLSLASSRVIPRNLATKMETRAPIDHDLGRGESALARLAETASRHQGQPAAEIDRAVEAAAREEAVRLYAGIGVLDVVITVSPLLGLLGTASGLVTIFQGLGETTDHLAIAGGIAEALNTTIFGLAIAVPCVIAHSYFTRRIDRLSARMESILTTFTTSIAHRSVVSGRIAPPSLPQS